MKIPRPQLTIASIHAEIDVLNQIKQKSIDLSGQNLTLYVDRAPCVVSSVLTA